MNGFDDLKWNIPLTLAILIFMSTLNFMLS